MEVMKDMMISPEGYYEEYLKGKSQNEILTEIRSLKREISRLKKLLEGDEENSEKTMLPSPLTRLKCDRAYLEMAKRAYSEAGGAYEPTRAERKDQSFNEALSQMKRFVFEIGGFFGGYDKRTYAVSGDKMVFDLEHSLYPKPSNSLVYEPFTTEEFIQGLSNLHIGEWKREYMNPLVLDGTQWSIGIEYEGGRRPFHIDGSNAYPYNFKKLTELFGIEEETEEEE